MSELETRQPAEYKLPMSVVTKLDVAHLVSELERIDEELTTASIRSKTGADAAVTSPVVSEARREFITMNTVELKTSQDRALLIKQLRTLKDTVPVVHMTFAVEVDRKSLSKLAEWLRSSVHPQAVIEAGLQPALVAGVYLRTPNRIHDLSLRAALKGSHDVLRQELGALYGRG